jgi:hypothetical protein
MFGPGLSVTNAAAKSSSINLSGLNGEIPVTMNPDLMFGGDNEWRKACHMILGK